MPIPESIIAVGLRILLIAAFSFLLDMVIKRVIPGALNRALVKERGALLVEEALKRAKTLSGVATKTATVVILAIATFMALSALGIDIAPLLTGAGIVGIALGFGAQSLVKDIISGLFILLENQYSKGDVVGIAGVYGLVEDVNLRRTVLRDLDGTVHSVPNGTITTSSNLTREYSRVNINVSVAYKENLDHVIRVLNQVGQELAQDETYGPFILEAPKVLRVDALEESGLAIKILGTTKPSKQWDVMGELRKRIKEAFDREGIEIPFPHRVIIGRPPPAGKLG
ncbi:MAG: mechanosensitive ion channel family protein [Chloroflexi bacterium]|nr:mechanosensitive ion channel family protein [Chloroflexota bacterium]